MFLVKLCGLKWRKSDFLISFSIFLVDCIVRTHLCSDRYGFRIAKQVSAQWVGKKLFFGINHCSPMCNAATTISTSSSITTSNRKLSASRIISISRITISPITSSSSSRAHSAPIGMSFPSRRIRTKCRTTGAISTATQLEMASKLMNLATWKTAVALSKLRLRKEVTATQLPTDNWFRCAISPTKMASEPKATISQLHPHCRQQSPSL